MIKTNELPKFKKKKFDIKSFEKLVEETRSIMTISELAGWNQMSRGQKLEWLKDRVEDIYNKI